MTRSRFFTFEGLDGSGKSTHLHECAELLSRLGHDVLTTKEPGGTELGEAIRKLFLDPRRKSIDGGVELMMVFASRRQHLLEVIEPALERGSYVLCDRFTDSTFAYQGYGRGVPSEQIDAIDAVATGRRRPDRTFYFDLPAEVARARGQSASRRAATRVEDGADRIDREDLEFYGRVREGYLRLVQLEPDRFLRVDSSGEIEVTRAAVRSALRVATGIDALADPSLTAGSTARRNRS